MRASWLSCGIWGAGLLLIGLLAWQVRVRDSMVWQLDREIAANLKEHADTHPKLLNFAKEATHEGGLQTMLAVALVAAVLLCICGNPRLAAIWVLATAMGVAISNGAKDLIDRPRPGEGLRDRSVRESNASFPSGHAMGSMIGYGALAYVGLALLRGRMAKIAVILLVVAIVAVIGWTRVYLRAHWCSDVIGGWLIGWCWLALCVKVGGGRR